MIDNVEAITDIKSARQTLSDKNLVEYNGPPFSPH